MGRFFSKKRGFTLGELVLSLGLLALAWLAAANLIIVSKYSASLAKHKAQAAYIAHQAIENLRKQTFSAMASSTTTVTLDTKGTPTVYTDDLNATQVVTVTTPATHYKLISVELDWYELFFGRRKLLKEYCATFISDDPQAN